MLYHIKTSRAGEPGYYAIRERGTVDVWHDSKRYVYRASLIELRDFKANILSAFGTRCEAKISGAWPSYTVETFA